LRVGTKDRNVRVEKSAGIRYASGEWKYYIAVPVLFERRRRRTMDGVTEPPWS
jgi:hypothetical protein